MTAASCLLTVPRSPTTAAQSLGSLGIFVCSPEALLAGLGIPSTQVSPPSPKWTCSRSCVSMLHSSPSSIRLRDIPSSCRRYGSCIPPADNISITSRSIRKRCFVHSRVAECGSEKICSDKQVCLLQKAQLPAARGEQAPTRQPFIISRAQPVNCSRWQIEKTPVNPRRLTSATPTPRNAAFENISETPTIRPSAANGLSKSAGKTPNTKTTASRRKKNAPILSLTCWTSVTG